MALYKLTKGTVSRIRTDKKGVDALLKDGYKLDGEVDEKYEVVDDRPTIKAARKKKGDSDVDKEDIEDTDIPNESDSESGAADGGDDTADSDNVEADSE